MSGAVLGAGDSLMYSVSYIACHVMSGQQELSVNIEQRKVIESERACGLSEEV